MEITISQPLGATRMIYAMICLAAMSMAIGIDLVELGGKDHLFVNAMLALAVGPAFLFSQHRYYRNFVDEARAGPGYVVALRGGKSIVIAVNDITRTRSRSFSRGDDRCMELILRHATAFGDSVRFRPQSDWRQTWQDNETTKDLLRRMA